MSACCMYTCVNVREPRKMLRCASKEGAYQNRTIFGRRGGTARYSPVLVLFVHLVVQQAHHVTCRGGTASRARTKRHFEDVLAEWPMSERPEQPSRAVSSYKAVRPEQRAPPQTCVRVRARQHTRGKEEAVGSTAVCPAGLEAFQGLQISRERESELITIQMLPPRREYV